MTILEQLQSHGVPYVLYDHPPVFTCEEAERLCPPMEGAQTKNLFLRDKKGKRHLLVSVPYGKTIDLKALAATLDLPGVSFASPERLKTYLGVEPGSVTLLGVIHDATNAVEVFVDEELWQADRILCHPLRNTATLSIPRADLERFLTATGHPPKIIRLAQ